MIKPDIMDWITADLRYVSGNQKRLKQLLLPWKKEHNTDIKEGKGIIVSGLSATTRPRIIYCMGEKLWSVMVPWDPDAKYSAYLAVSEFMRKQFVLADFIQDALDEEIDRAKEAQKRSRKARKKRLHKARKKRKHR